MSTDHLLLKILSGPHQGAEIALKQGTIIIGSDPDCDIVLSDMTMADKQLKLSLSGEDSLSITPLAENTFLDGQALAGQEEPYNIEPFQYITLGTTHLVIGPSNQTWPALHPPDIQALEREVVAEEAVEEEVPEAASNDPEPIKKIKRFVKRQLALQKTPQDWLRPAIILSATFILLLAIIFWPNSSKTWEVSDAQLHVLQDHVQQILDETDLVTDGKVLIQRGQVVASGHVKTDADKALLRQTIESISPNVALIIWSEESLVRACEDILNILNLPLRVNARSLGIVQIEGYSPDPKAWERARQHLLADIPGLDDIEDDVITAEQVGELSLLVLKKYDLHEMVTISAAPNALVAQGIIDTHMVKRWNQAKANLETLFSSVVPLVDWITVSSVSDVERVYFDSEVASINLTGDTRWLTLKNGKTFFEGSHLPTGYVIEEIALQGVFLKKGDETITLSVGQSGSSSTAN